MSGFDLDVAIVGSGPSGIAAATALWRAGVKNIVVYEREAQIGGIPRHTHHRSFGLLIFKRPLSGPKFVAALRRRCSDVKFQTSATITALRPGGELEIATPTGLQTVRARHIILATGARETPRHARLVPGLRPQGVMTTGALQQLIYGARLQPFKHPVIVGTELVSFSALLTLRHAGIKPVAMIEAGPRITAYRPAALFARLLGVPIRYNCEITDIGGPETVQQVGIRMPGGADTVIPCDGLIFSGCFVGDNPVAGASHLGLSPRTRIPQVDQNWVTSDPAISAIGNSVHPADMGDQCYREGLQAGEHVARLLAEKAAPAGEFVSIRHGDGVKMTTPSILRRGGAGETRFDLALHVTAPFSGTVRVSRGEDVLYQKTRRCLPARRITLRDIALQSRGAANSLPIDVTLVGQT